MGAISFAGSAIFVQRGRLTLILRDASNEVCTGFDLFLTEMSGANMIVFRDGADDVSGRDLAARYLRNIQSLKPQEQTSTLDALLLAGEVECALNDSEHPYTQSAIAITDAMAALFVNPSCGAEKGLLSRAQQLADKFPLIVRVSQPEGFAYYALHPGDFADAVAGFSFSGSAAIVGIRSIGTTLSAVAMAALNAKGIAASRTTVRPTGHPYDRETRFSPQQQSWVAAENQRGSAFLVVDEGPGLSGSSFLSAAEALLALGVSANRITLLGTHDVTPSHLCARDAARRWMRFSWNKVPSRIYRRFEHMTPLGGGNWRDLILASSAEWPPCWPEMEALKFWSDDRQSIYKFEGLGRAGNSARERSKWLYHAGYGVWIEDAGDGMTQYEFVSGTPLTPASLSAEILLRMAKYCAYRATEFRTSRQIDPQLSQMLSHNFFEETGQRLELADALCSPSPVIADGHMQPYEWIQGLDGRTIKVDAAQHGDDHFLPGPTDIAWDLAGAIVEWNMSAEAEQYFLSSFRAHGGKTEKEQMDAFTLAYCAFRTGYCRMALSASPDPEEHSRWRKAHLYYRAKMIESARTRFELAS